MTATQKKLIIIIVANCHIIIVWLSMDQYVTVEIEYVINIIIIYNVKTLNL